MYGLIIATSVTWLWTSSGMPLLDPPWEVAQPYKTYAECKEAEVRAMNSLLLQIMRKAEESGNIVRAFVILGRCVPLPAPGEPV